MRLDLAAIRAYNDGEGQGRWELAHRESDGLVLIRFFNKHGSLYDVVDANEFAIPEVR